MKQFVTDIPAIKVLVRNKYLTGNEQDNELTEGYLIAVTSLPSRPLLFTVHLITGAMFSRLPIIALICPRYIDFKSSAPELDIGDAQPYSCLEGDIQVISYIHFKDYEVACKIKDNDKILGRYLFTVDYAGPGLAEDPEQFKSHNIIALNDGNLVALPNNMCLFVDEYFAKVTEWPKNYRRQTKYQQGST